MSIESLPPGQQKVDKILRWNVDHPGITKENPKVDLSKWTLIVDGEVEKPLKLTWKDFLKLPAVESKSDFHCVEGWSVKDCRWYGVKFTTLIQIVKPTDQARYVLIRCLDNYSTSLQLEDLLHNNVILAYKLNNEYLEEALGAPVRLVVPLKYAYKSAMWISHIHFQKEEASGFWERRGYSDSANVWKDDRFAS